MVVRWAGISTKIACLVKQVLLSLSRNNRMNRPPMNVLRPMVRRDIRPQTAFLLEMKFETPERLMLLGV